MHKTINHKFTFSVIFILIYRKLDPRIWKHRNIPNKRQNLIRNTNSFRSVLRRQLENIRGQFRNLRHMNITREL
ncbi:hypothetical protein Hanom_Chr11g00972291 [Helianthus anomalus]